MKYPRYIMEDIYWSFDEDIETDLKSFCQRLIEYNKELEEEVDPEAIALQVPEIMMRFYDDVDKEDEDEYEEDEDENDEVDDEEDGQEENDEENDDEDFDKTGYTDFSIKSDTGNYLSTGETLFTIHKNVAPVLQSRDFRFFEGLRLSKHQSNPGLPLYVLTLGS